MTIKTTLVPGVAWPTKEAKVSDKKDKDTNFEKWQSKQKQPVDFRKILGDFQNARMQASLGRK